jgi:hypothetical protein
MYHRGDALLTPSRQRVEKRFSDETTTGSEGEGFEYILTGLDAWVAILYEREWGGFGYGPGAG